MSTGDGPVLTDEPTVPIRGRWPAEGLEAGGLRLRVWCPDDVPQLLAHLADPEMRRWSPVFVDPDETSCLERVRRARAAQEEGLACSFAVVDAGAPDVVLGSIDWRNGFPPPPFSILDVGYGVVAAARGRGVAAAALRMLTEWLLAPDGGDVHRVQLDHAVANLASCRTALRAGFVVEGRREGYLPLREHPGAPVVRHAVCLHGRWRRS